jgi:3',5'-cyclic AMP phosphodiesterase CpdA
MKLRALISVLAALIAGAACSPSPGGDQSDDPPREVSPADVAGGVEDASSADDAEVADGGDADRTDVDQPDADEQPAAPVYELSARPYTTLQALWAPRPLSEAARQAMSSGDVSVTDIARYAEFDIGVQLEEGQPWVEHDELAPGFVAGEPDARRSLLYFWEAADPQMIDQESPIRFAGTTVAPMGSTYRPQSHLIAQIFESQVRSARRIGELGGRTFDFAFIAGDLTDGGQENELDWTLEILAGGIIHPDSGVEDDPVAGPGNDYTDPFWSEGIGVPWYAALGNHETNYMGFFPASDTIQEAAVGDRVIDFTSDLPILRNIDGASNGFRDASTVDGEVVTEGTTPADARRRILELGEVLDAIYRAGGQPAGHGLDANNVFEELGYFSFQPIEGRPIRFIVLNTVIRTTSSAMGGMDRRQFEWLEQQLTQARRADELVIVGSHHKPSAFAPFSIVSGGDLEELLASYDNVLMHVAGHGHKNTKQVIRPDGDHGPERGYWEIMCSSTVDFPLQSRIIELVYEGQGFLSVYVTNLEHNAADGTLARAAFDLAAGRKYFADRSYRSSWEEQRAKMNMVLRFKLADRYAQALEAHQWPERVESQETLLALEGP